MYKNSLKTVGRLSIVGCTVLMLNTSISADTNVCVKQDTTQVDRLAQVDKEKLAKLSKDFAKALEVIKGHNLTFIKDLGGVFDTIQGIMSSVATAKVDFDVGTVETRIKLAIKLIENIKLAVEKLTDKEQYVLNKYGFAVTGVILDALNPLTKNPTLIYDLSKLDAIITEAINGPEMTPESVANVNKKEAFARALRKYRSFIFGKLFVVKNSADFNKFQQEIAKATLVRLNPETKLKEVNAYIAKLEGMKKELDTKLEQLGDANIIASIPLKEEFAKELRSARALKFGELKYKDRQVNRVLDKEILRLTGIRLDPRASIAEVNQAREDLKVAIKTAQEAEDVFATYESKRAFSKALSDARFYKFNILAKKSYETIVELDRVILELTGVDIKIRPTQQEIDEALKTLNDAIAKAKASPDIQ